MFAVIKRKSALLAALGVLLTVALLLGNYCLGTAAVLAGRVKRKLPIYSVETSEPVVALSFDAAWGAERTDSLIEILKDNDAAATFFLVGMWVEKHPDKLKKLHEAGFEIGTHSSTHPDMTKIPAAKMRLELETSMNLIENQIGIRPKVFRPPFGAYSDTLLQTAEELGLMTIQWDVDSLDWKEYSASQIAQRVLSRVRNGSIVLMHNDGKNTPEALKLILIGLKNKGYRTVKISDLVYKDNYTIDHTGRQIKISGKTGDL